MASNSSPPRHGKRKRERSSKHELCDPHEKKPRKTSKDSSNSASKSDVESLASQSRQSNRNQIGVIERISLKNFMCHSLLEFVFEPRVNFINGRNGSGKSAILTALMVGLGGKASVTNRGSKVSSLIQKGRKSARIEITLSNRGPEAFKHELYGDSITIVRTLQGTGGSYEIRAADKRVVSTKRAELQAILQHLNIQVDNPVVVLNQETSRSFLQSKSSKDKYVFFLKATQLEEVKANYEEAEQSAQQALETYKSKAQLLPDIEDQIKKQERLLKVIENVENAKSKLKKLQQHLSWSAVGEKEASVHSQKMNLSKTEELIKEIGAEFEILDGEAKAIELEIEGFDTQERGKVKETPALVRDLGEKENKMSEDKRQFRTLEDEKRRIERSIRNFEADRSTLQNEIKRATANTDEKWIQEKERRSKEIVRVTEKIDSMKSEELEAIKEEQSVRETRKILDERMRESGTDLRKAQEDIRRIQHQIETAKAAKADEVNRFGPNTSRLLREIQSASFRQPPKGPLGLHLKLKVDRWQYAVERHCGKTLSAYMVDNNEDYKLLKNILSKFGVRNVTIYTRKFTGRQYSCPVTKSSESCTSFLDVVSFTDPDVHNLFVDTNQINQILLYESLDNALAALKHTSTVPKHCAQALDAEYNRVCPAPRYRFFSNDKRPQVRLLNVSGDVLPELERDLNVCRNLENQTKKELKDSQVKLVASESSVRKAKEVTMRVRQRIAELSSTIKELQDFEEPVRINVGPLEDELSALDKKIDELTTQQLPEAVKKLAEFTEIIRETNRSLKLAERTLSDHKEKIEELKSILRQHNERINFLQRKIQDNDSRSSTLKSTAKEQQKELKGIEKELKAAIKTAEKSCPRPEVMPRNSSTSSLQLQIRALEEEIIIQERTQPNPERTATTHAALKEQFASLSEELGAVKVYLDELQKLVKQRKETFVKVRDLACFRVCTVFESLMANEKFHATLEFDHSNRRLEIKVHEMAQQRTAHSDVRGLSGGERSYSTVCFICALWTNTEHTPFRVLDEFDIFMDMSKRRRSLQMLLEICEKQVGCQFIFLTPIEMPNIDALNSSSVKCQLMPEPKRTSS